MVCRAGVGMFGIMQCGRKIIACAGNNRIGPEIIAAASRPAELSSLRSHDKLQQTRAYSTAEAMTNIHLIGGEKGGVGKTLVARLLAQYFIDHSMAFCRF